MIGVVTASETKGLHSPFSFSEILVLLDQQLGAVSIQFVGRVFVQ